jgi:hypothetical protein
VLSLIIFISILVIVFAGISLTSKDPFRFLGGGVFYIIFGYYALHHGGIVGRDGRIITEISGGYFTSPFSPSSFYRRCFY